MLLAGFRILYRLAGMRPLGPRWAGFRRAEVRPVCSRHLGIFRTCGRGDSLYSFCLPLSCGPTTDI
uniref:Uncharacterized protein n=1 Tax=Arundo donax TaxID=35708 RepID=A0A0A8YYL0_ARUDO